MKMKVKKTVAKTKPEKASAPTPPGSPKLPKEAPPGPASPKLGKEPAPKKDKVEKTPEKKEQVSVSPEEKERLTKEALGFILQGIAQPDAQKNGATFVPEGWHMKYKPALGPYKKFVASQGDTLAVMEKGNGSFVVMKAGDKPPGSPAMKPGSNWKKLLDNAWNTYCQATPKHERTVDVFVAALPKGARNTKPEAAAAPAAGPKTSPKVAPAAPAPVNTPKTSPKVSPKTSPKAEAAPAPAAEKRKAEEPAGGMTKKKKKKAGKP